MSIRAVELYRYPADLKKPYHTSFGDLAFFDSVIAVIRTDEGVGAGESTAVPGYSWESPQDVWQFAVSHAPLLIGMSADEARSLLNPLVPKAPFGVTPLLSAVEEAAVPPSLHGELALAGILNVTEIREIPREVENLLAQGFHTIKFKIGFDVESDVRKTKLIQQCLKGRALLRLDANQHYTLDEARHFARAVSPEGIELLEQPFGSHDWDTMLRFSPESPLPLMLDESIYGPDDIRRAIDSRCAAFIKLKLCKAGSMENLCDQGRLVSSGGMKLVIGNGVATDIACRQELAASVRLAASGIAVAAGEMNGFLKLVNQTTESSPIFRNGNIMLNSGCPLPDTAELQAKATDWQIFR